MSINVRTSCNKSTTDNLSSAKNAFYTKFPSNFHLTSNSREALPHIEVLLDVLLLCILRVLAIVLSKSVSKPARPTPSSLSASPHAWTIAPCWLKSDPHSVLLFSKSTLFSTFSSSWLILLTPLGQ